jgi:integrase
VNGAWDSALGAQIEAFIAFKRAMGAAYLQGEYYLRRFDAHLAREGLSRVSREACEGFIAEVGAGRPDASRNWVSCLRGLARWMRRHGDPGAWEPPSYPAPPRPATYLFRDQELDAFFAQAAAHDGPAPWRWQAKAFFALMHSCGLRTGEARRLDRAGVDLDGLAVTVRDSKGPRTRVLPITGEVAAVLADCDRSNDRWRPGREPLFVSASGARLGHSAPARVFNQIWDAAGLPRPAEPPYPRAYDLRHHFAYANLERWAAAGADTAALLPYLARYMGHASPQSTLYYLHVSPDFIASYDQLARATEGLLPEAGFDA